MKTGRILRRAMSLLCVLALSLTGCAKTGKLDEGDCACVVRLESIPQEFKMLGDNEKSLLGIEVVLENITTERRYTFALNEENGFAQDASLNPGTYKVYYCSASPYFLHMKMKAREDQLNVSKGGSNELTVYIENMEEFTDTVWNAQPTREIMQQDKFSRKVQWNGQIIDMQDITEYIDFTLDRQVRGYEQVSLSGSGIMITVQNQTSESVDWTECELIKVQAGASDVIFPQGARVGMSVKEIVHAQDGIYGTPDSMTGFLLIGTGMDKTGMVYYDESSGDKITLECTTDAEYICDIIYEFAVYE
ncbi:MAG: hypothetical protein K1W26_08405 [Acetatifactor sp.]